MIGGGAIALSTAIELALQGAKVTVISRDFKQAATHAAAGMLVPQAEQLPPGPMLELGLRSRSLYPEWIQKLEALAGLNAEYWPCGSLAPAYAEDISSGIIPSHQQSAADSQWLDQATIRQFQPQLSPQVIGGWWFPKDAQVNNRTLARVLWAAVRELGVNLCEGVSAEAIQHQQGQITRIETAAGDWQAEQYILATGAWSGQLLSVPVVPRKGQMLAVQAIPTQEVVQPLQQVLFGTQIYLVPRRDGQIVIGATIEDVGFTPDNTPAGIQSLLEAAIALYPPIRDFPIREFWWGFRPATPDEWPILGYGPYRNLILATGHYRNGILLAPVTATLLVDLILRQKADPLLTHFGWERFKPRL
jgi:glycine oxidase ThiO